MNQITQIAKIGIDSTGQIHCKLSGAPLPIVKQALITSLEGVIEQEVRQNLESKIVQPSGKAYIKTDAVPS